MTQDKRHHFSVAILPIVERYARRVFSWCDPEEREERTAEVAPESGFAAALRSHEHTGAVVLAAWLVDAPYSGDQGAAQHGVVERPRGVSRAQVGAC